MQMGRAVAKANIAFLFLQWITCSVARNASAPTPAIIQENGGMLSIPEKSFEKSFEWARKDGPVRQDAKTQRRFQISNSPQIAQISADCRKQT